MKSDRQPLTTGDYQIEFFRMTRTLQEGRWSRRVALNAIDALLDEYLERFGPPTYATA